MNKRGAPKGSRNAAKPAAKKKTDRRAINLPLSLGARVTKHLHEIDMTWPDWARAIIETALDEQE